MAEAETAAPEVLLDRDGIEATVARLAGELSERFDDGLVMAGVLRGSVPFLADLVRALTIRTVVDFLAITPYAPGTGRVWRGTPPCHWIGGVSSGVLRTVIFAKQSA